MTSRSRAALVALGTAALIALAGCTAPEPEPTVSSAPAETPSASPTPTEPALVPDGDAAANQPYFDLVVGRVLAADGNAGGRAFIDALTDAGFDKGAMQVTPDATAIGLDADSVQFSVRIGEGCIIGQRGGGATGQSIVTPVLATGSCLVGTTRAIDW
ncbi:DUF6993 domain-containing protein [Arenivirga flava]|uniref:DUF6993 domain-containing protein n=1 Tax=Arenivirga flava TaxID=1930060 RepID=A0AA37UGX3_9MICO|nr:hypothetical protein [Arenivirga flava]GMA28583.1 hypothetical protein GCM10025874_18360 [Arenivirga flava]